MRCPRLSELLKDPPSEKARTWILEMRGTAYQRYYLKSRLWREVIRPKVLERDGYKCAVCERFARHVHHLSYDEDTMLGRDLSQLKCVCVKHHESAHFGAPALELGPLTKRFTEVAEEQRTENRLREEFNSIGGRLLVSAKLSRGWWTCDFQWEFPAKYETVVDSSDRHFIKAAYVELELSGRNSRPGKVGGNRFTKKGERQHSVIFFWESYHPLDGKIKLRAKTFPDWIAALTMLTSRHPFAVVIVGDRGREVGRSGGYVEPPPPPEKPTKTIIEKWSDTILHTGLTEDDPDWEKYPFGETVIEHTGPMP